MTTNISWLSINQLTILFENIGNFTYPTELDLSNKQLNSLPDSIGNLTNLIRLSLNLNQLTNLPENIGSLHSLNTLNLCLNQLSTLPESIVNLTELTTLHLDGNPLTDLSILQYLPNLKIVTFLYVSLPRRYWTKLSNWKAEWLLDEDNVGIRRALVEVLGYEKVFEKLDILTFDRWREYTLLKIDNSQFGNLIVEPMVLLKMTCPSTSHIHILRVPPEMVSAEDAIMWVNHGIHPDQFVVQT
jgi:leucine-rich repeat protein SHOC2